MNSSEKVILFLVAAFCFLQFAAARKELDGLFLENVKFDLTRKCANLERDFDRDFANAKHKLIKESTKLTKKAKKPEAVDCIETVRLQAEEELDEKSQETTSCIKDVRDTLETDLKADAEIREIFAFRNQFKNQLNNCKRTAKTELKATLNVFSDSGKRCLI